MIITKTPMRITLGGGGTDLPEYYSKKGGFWISATIDKFVYVAIKRRFESQIRLAYSQIEIVDDIKDIEHGIFRVALDSFDITEHTEISTLADLPSGTGLGSSGSFTVGLVNALSIYKQMPIQDLADFAYYLERGRLKRPVGKQDQYAALHGGVRVYRADKKGRITQAELQVPDFDKHLLMFYSHIQRSSTPLLEDVAKRLEYLDRIKTIGEQSWDALNKGDYNLWGELLHQHWIVKREMSPHMSNERIDSIYKLAQRNGAIGGKVIGAGGGGFLLFYAQTEEAKTKIRREMTKMKLSELYFRFHNEGTKVLDV